MMNGSGIFDSETVLPFTNASFLVDYPQPSYDHDLYEGLSHPVVITVHAVLTVLTIFVGPITLLLVKCALDRIKLDLVFYDINTMGLQLKTLGYHVTSSCSLLIR